MSKPRIVHLHIPAGFEGEIHVHVDADVETGVLPVNGSGPISTPAVETILKRFEDFDSTTAARAVHDALVERGWFAVAPASRSTACATSNAPCVRLLYKGTDKTASVYLNTASLVFARKGAAELAAAIDAAELHADGAMYLYHSSGHLEQALDGMALVERWADGELKIQQG
jgi:hypothetical protein